MKSAKLLISIYIIAIIIILAIYYKKSNNSFVHLHNNTPFKVKPQNVEQSSQNSDKEIYNYLSSIKSHNNKN
ncbi:hypothetical protein HL033_02585 [Neoehrlichia mikurensis]|uniref:Uncharacterized protein n=1 Tax=Neoehrlichia mikurensis TaxID=89586 RepID=A0A9Q9BSZ5_9RICK|nr:hypothetical protein [Neoehrlichia mikurensis]QXK91647.1 hypothetical protein IAH97_02580 [Neoehrlichia mikurensis]QXK92858.1 hypothetical protein HUN61_02575 [Neoehrlichia mikurensis]QXK93338.1 hypothetical protein HL033_02585 [Neoehrlichia mikurensis]UTO55720.1 hypothetical protein LUA82_01405 [Neoehrlichia mikurensis]UTO56637.1 hypothetical protein LUA81_01395 [Neoehrlichia mikurensis]